MVSSIIHSPSVNLYMVLAHTFQSFGESTRSCQVTAPRELTLNSSDLQLPFLSDMALTSINDSKGWQSLLEVDKPTGGKQRSVMVSPSGSGGAKVTVKSETSQAFAQNRTQDTTTPTSQQLSKSTPLKITEGLNGENQDNAVEPPLKTSKPQLTLPIVPNIVDGNPVSPTAAGQAIYDFVQNMQGKSLSQSIWAPKNVSRSINGKSSRPLSPVTISDLTINTKSTSKSASVERLINASTQTELTMNQLNSLLGGVTQGMQEVAEKVTQVNAALPAKTEPAFTAVPPHLRALKTKEKTYVTSVIISKFESNTLQATSTKPLVDETSSSDPVVTHELGTSTNVPEHSVMWHSVEEARAHDSVSTQEPRMSFVPPHLRVSAEQEDQVVPTKVESSSSGGFAATSAKIKEGSPPSTSSKSRPPGVQSSSHVEEDWAKRSPSIENLVEEFEHDRMGSAFAVAEFGDKETICKETTAGKPEVLSYQPKTQSSPSKPQNSAKLSSGPQEQANGEVLKPAGLQENGGGTISNSTQSQEEDECEISKLLRLQEKEEGEVSGSESSPASDLAKSPVIREETSAAQGQPAVTPKQPPGPLPDTGRPKFNPLAYGAISRIPDKLPDRSNQFVFESWGGQLPRAGPSKPCLISQIYIFANKVPVVAEVRTVILRPLPPNSTPAFVSSIVFGGQLERIHMLGESAAFVTFLHGSDCQRFYAATDNGLVYGKSDDGREKFVHVRLGKEVDIVAGQLKEWISKGWTRCVRATHVDEDITLQEMKAQALGKRRALEKIDEFRHPEKGVSPHMLLFTRIPSSCCFQ